MDGISFGYLNADQWLYMRLLCDGRGRRLDAAQALAHARSCRTCVYSLAEIAAGRPAAETITLTRTLVAA